VREQIPKYTEQFLFPLLYSWGTLAVAVVVTLTSPLPSLMLSQPVIWPGGASTRLCPLRHWTLRHRPRHGPHRHPSVRHRHRPLGIPHCHRPALGTPYHESNLHACTQVRRGCHRVCSRMPRIVRLHGFRRSREGLLRGILCMYMFIAIGHDYTRIPCCIQFCVQ
jgi:hypothetical protein